jgi:hypothetical protein
MVLLHHHLEAVAQTDSEAQKMVVVGIEEIETAFPHMDCLSQIGYHSSIHLQHLNFLAH